MKIKKILVANRGEIACRIMRTAQEMGIKTVAVYSEADRNAPHVLLADEAVCIGAPPSAASYLLGDKIIAAAQALGADAIHPAYGFLSENADFAEKVSRSGLVFIGPSAQSIAVMGSKLAAKKAVSQYKNIPLIPGTSEAVEDPEIAKAKAREIGYPVLIKASAGGGGKGMRVVESEDELPEQMARAISEAKSAFGNGAVFIEKYFTQPRHIEIQILGDKHGNIVHLFERECSIQRRHQKVIEEAPCPIMTPEVRKKMGEAAIAVAKSCAYYGAGTVEFIADDQLNFYFLEMNTRLQVEHPVTEEITGIDLVRAQIRIAEGKPLDFKQEDLKIHGHAIEVRVYAEDPCRNFLPDIGKLQTYQRPQGIGIRVDDGFREGMDIPIYYDPMIAKLISRGENRTQAIARLCRAIDHYQITGISTTLDFCKFVLQHEAFVSGNFNTKFLAQHFKPEYLFATPTEDELTVAAAFLNHISQKSAAKTHVSAQKTDTRISPWRQRARR